MELLGGDALTRTRQELGDPTLPDKSDLEHAQERYDFCLEGQGYYVEASTAALHRESDGSVTHLLESEGERRAVAAMKKELNAVELGWKEEEGDLDVAVLTGKGEIKVEAAAVVVVLDHHISVTLIFLIIVVRCSASPAPLRAPVTAPRSWTR